MPSRAPTLLMLLLLCLPPLVQAQDAPSVTPVAATPDGNGGFHLEYDVMRAAGNVTLALEVRVVDDAGEGRAGSRALGTRALGAGTTRVNVSFLPAEGPGDYAVALVVDGASSAPLTFRADGSDGASATLTFDVPDEPTRLWLANDTVNADNKLKSPGETLVTRAFVEDGNGLADVERVRWRVTSANVPFTAAGDATLSPLNATTASLEIEFARSPIPAATYRMTLEAARAGTVLAVANRTFIIRNVAPVILAAPTLDVVPDEEQTVVGALVIGDRNGIDNASVVESRVYRGSARVERNGFRVDLSGEGPNATLGNGSHQLDNDGFGRVAFSMATTVPANATEGTYRISFYSENTLVGTVPLEVRAVPTLANASVRADADGLFATVTGTGYGHATLHAGGSVATADFRAGANLSLPADNATSGEWRIELRARPDGRVLDARNGTWTRAAPELRVTAPRSTARLPAAWRLDAPGYDVPNASANVTVLRWDGTAAPGVTARFQGGRVILDGPADIEVGRYEVRAELSWPNGTLARVTWHFETGPWLRFALGAPQADGRTARVGVTNTGGVPIGRILVELEGAAGNVTLQRSDGSVVPAEMRGGRLVLDARLAPGDTATLLVALPGGPMASGARTLELRALALPEAAP